MKSANTISESDQIIPNRSSVHIYKGIKRDRDVGYNILTINNLFYGFMGSLIWHIIFVIVFNNHVALQTIEFWLLFVCDTILLTISIVPIIACIRKQIAWYDPLCLLSIIFICITSGFFPSYLADPIYVVSWITMQGAANLGIKDGSDLLLAAIKAESIFFIFIVIVYFINRRTIKVSPVRFNYLEIKYVIFFTLILFLISLYFFTYLWTFQSYLNAITVGIGSYEVKNPTIGTARYYILSDIGIPSLSLCMIALLITNTIKGKIPYTILIVSVTFLSIIPTLFNGSRINLVASIYIIIAMIAWFGLKVDWYSLAWVSAVIVLLFISVTVLRGNQKLSSQPEVVVNQLISGEAAGLYNAYQPSIIKNIANIDRVGVVILVMQYIKNGKDYMYGESLVAGLVYYIYDFGARLGMINPNEVTPISWANDRIMTWVFGYKPLYLGTYPPSIPGEFYMQGGLIGEVFLSTLFGWLILWLRRNCANSKNLAVRWIFIYLTLRIIFLIPAEVSGLASYLVFYLPFWLFIVLAIRFFYSYNGRSNF